MKKEININDKFQVKEYGEEWQVVRMSGHEGERGEAKAIHFIRRKEGKILGDPFMYDREKFLEYINK